MTDSSSQPGTSVGTSSIVNYISDSYIENLNQTINACPSTSSSTTDAVIDYCLAPVSTFIGRSGDLTSLKTLFTQHQVVALVGMGGLGKTQLSRKYVLDNKAVYQYKYWLESETPEKLKNSFKNFARKLNVESDNIDELVNDVYKKIQVIPTILIFDNVEKPADVYGYLPTRVVLQPGVTIHVLVTSRWADWTCDKRIECYKLQPLNVAESLKILEEKFGESCIDTMKKEWKKLAEMLGHLPLALQVATSYIQKLTKHNSDLLTVLADYMKQLTKGARRLLKDPLPEYDNGSVHASMLLTLEQLEHKTDDAWKFAVTLINAAAYMDPDRIYKEHLLKLLENDDNTWILDEALVILTGFSLFNQGVDWTGKNVYTVHRIIQTSIRHNQTENKTADIHYTGALKYALDVYDYFTDVFQYANDRASAVVCYYEENPTPMLLVYLVRCKGITAVEGIFELMTGDQIQSLINQEDLLYRAVASGDLSMTQLLGHNGADVNQLSCMMSEPPIHRALWEGYMDIVKWLLQNGASPAVRDKEGCTALHVAIMHEKHEIVPDMIQADKALVHATDNEGNTPLLTIGYSDKEEDILSTISALIDNGADITRENMWGDTVLHSGAHSARASAVTLILQLNKHLINVSNKNGQTPLHVIPYHSTHIDDERIRSIIPVLAEGGVDLTKVDVQGNTVLHYAARAARAAVVTTILKLNKDLINIENEYGQTALHVLPYYDTDIDDERIRTTTRVLAEGGADLTKADVRGDTVLHSAARGARAAVVTLTLQLNKHLINIVNEDGETALHVVPYDNAYIDDGRILSITRALAEGGGDLTKVDARGNTVLHSAARGARAAVVTLILQLNKHLINIVNEDGQTALHVLGNGFIDYIVFLSGKTRKNVFESFKESARLLVMNGLSLDATDKEGCTPLDILPSEFKDTLRQVADECSNQLVVRAVKRLGTDASFSWWCCRRGVDEVDV